MTTEQLKFAPKGAKPAKGADASNFVEIRAKDGHVFFCDIHRADDAKAFAKWLWATGLLDGVCVVNKKDQISLKRGELL